jgi:hypothetical protein
MLHLETEGNQNLKNALDFETRVPSGKNGEAAMSTDDSSAVPECGFCRAQPRNPMCTVKYPGQRLSAVAWHLVQ